MTRVLLAYDGSEAARAAMSVAAALFPAKLDGPVLAGYDASDDARGALRFAAAHLAQRPIVVAHAWRSPVRHTLRGQALAHSHIDTFEAYVEAVDTIWGEVAALPIIVVAVPA